MDEYVSRTQVYENIRKAAWDLLWSLHHRPTSEQRHYRDEVAALRKALEDYAD